MSDLSGPPSLGNRELEVLVQRAVAECVDPLRSQVATMGRALAVLAVRSSGAPDMGEVLGRLAAVASRLDELDRADGFATLERTVTEALAEVGARVSSTSSAALSASEAHLAERLDEVVARLERSVAPLAGVPGQLAEVTAAAAAFEAAAAHSTQARGTQADDLRHVLATAVQHAVAQVDQGRAADADRLLERIGALEAPLRDDAEARQASTNRLQEAITASLEHALAQVDAGRADTTAAVERTLTELEARRASEASRLLEQITALAEAVAADVGLRQAESENLRASVASQLEEALAVAERARSDDIRRVTEQIATLEGPLAREALERAAQIEELHRVVAANIDQAVGRVESGRGADTTRVLEQVTAVLTAADDEARRRDEQAKALLIAVDERLEALHAAGVGDGADREARLVARLEEITAEHGQGLLARLEERAATATDLELIPRVSTVVHEATSAALTSQVEPLVARLVEAIDTLAHEGGRIEALARGHAGEARAVEERVATMFSEVAERAETAVDRSRARIAEGQVALGARFDVTMGELLATISGATDRLEASLAGSAEGLRTAAGHQSGALLDAVNRSSHQLAEGLDQVRADLEASRSEGAGADAQQPVAVIAEQLDRLRATVESLRSDPRLDVLALEQGAAQQAQLTAIAAVSRRVDEVGPTVARALLSEVERAARSASAAEDAVATLRPEALRDVLGEAAERAVGDVQAAARRLDESIARLATVVDESREELLGAIRRGLDGSSAVTGETTAAGGAALEDLRASQATLREVVQDGAHKAELAALDIRGLRDRLTPHLAALAEATTRRADADQAGFDAVLARLDKLLAASHRGAG